MNLKIKTTEIVERGAGRFTVTLVLFDERAKTIDEAEEVISIKVDVTTLSGESPYLREVQREALEKARVALVREIETTKIAPGPSS